MDSSTHPHQDAINGLRELADYLADHPELPLWHIEATHICYQDDDREGIADVTAIARQLGVEVTGTCGKPVAPDTTHFNATRQFGPVKYQASYILRQEMADWRALVSYDGAIRAEQAGPAENSFDAQTSGQGDNPPDDEYQPCRYCEDAEDCARNHRGNPDAPPLAAALAVCLDDAATPADAQIGKYLADANDLLDDFPRPLPQQWTVRRLAAADSDCERDIEMRLMVNSTPFLAFHGDRMSRGQIITFADYLNRLDGAGQVPDGWAVLDAPIPVSIDCVGANHDLCTDQTCGCHCHHYNTEGGTTSE